MATRTVVCPECDEPVPYGRLSCPNCGSLLASVAGAPRRQAPLQAVAVAEPPTLVPDDDSNGHVAAATLESPSAPRVPATRTRRATTRAGQGAVAAVSASDTAPEPAEPAVEPAVEPPPPADEVGPAAAPGDLDDAAEPAPPDVEVPPSASAAGAATPAEPRWPGETPAPTWTRPTPPVIHDWPPAGAAAPPAPLPAAAAAAAAPASPAAPVAWPAPPPVIHGLQPATTTSEAVPAPHPRPVLPPTPAGSWLPPTASFGPAQPNGATAGNGHLAAAGTDPERTKPDRVSWLADLPFDAPDDLAGWLVTIGCAIAAVGFLLPWSARMPFAAGEFGYTDRWGLAVPSHLLLLLATLLLLVASVRPTPIPDWLRAGVAPLVLGGLLLGIVWPFVIGGFGSQIGSLAVAMAAMLLIVGGGLAIWAERHENPRSGV